MLKQIGKFLTGGVAEPIRQISGQFIAPADRKREMNHELDLAIMKSFDTYLSSEPKSWYERVIKAANMAPRPALALGTIGLFVYAFVDPVNFAIAIAGIANIPIGLWTLLTTISGFYFIGRGQVKSLEGQANKFKLENLEKSTQLILDAKQRLQEMKANENANSSSEDSA